MSDALSSQSVPGPRNAIASVAFASVADGTSRARYFFHSFVAVSSVVARTVPSRWSTTRTGPVTPALLQVNAEIAGQSAFDRDSVLSDPARARTGLFRSDLEADFATDRVRPVARVQRPVGRSRGVPGLLAEVGLLQVGKLVRGEPLKAAVDRASRPTSRAPGCTGTR